MVLRSGPQAAYYDGLDRVTYDVKVQSSIWVRHANQLRPSFQPVTVPSSRVIPLDILLDTFELLKTFQRQPQIRMHILEASAYPEDRSDRSRRHVAHMQLNPRQQSYVQ
ncbi:hypothetical protein AHF37_06130 [Paragonimus kellicotti]|nr:hypothetical protein AHF37_06130 [Paragonimus kellicotti]